MLSTSVGRWWSVDPLAENYGSWSPFNYVMNNPVRLVDKDGREIVVPNVKDRAVVLNYINSRSSGSYKLDNNGKLYQYTSGSPETGSTYYAEKLNAAIDDKNTITIVIAATVETNGKTKSVDDDFGGGVTIVTDETVLSEGRGKDQTVVISGNSNENLKDTNGKQLRDEPADILAHELVGHAIPKITKSDTGNAVKNENKVREQQPKKKDQKGPNPLRAPEPFHKE